MGCRVMADRRVGEQTVRFTNPPRIVSSATIVGPQEGKGNLAQYFDTIVDDHMMGETSAEKAERRLLEQACQDALAKRQLTTKDIQYFISGDLLNQIVAANFTARTLAIPFIGIYGACSSMVEGLGLAAFAVDGGFADKVLVATSSHYQSSERQFRYPIELNIQRKGTNHLTVTGAAAAVVTNETEGIKITEVTFGKVMDYGLKDPNDMGCAMAPAVADTVMRHFQDTGRTPGDYSLILTGDLGNVGKKAFANLVSEGGYVLGNKHMDAGASMFKPSQQSGSGGSGCACVAVTTLGYVVKEMYQGRFHRVLVVGSGALYSPLTYQQGESIPSIGHAIVLEQ